MVAFPPDDQTLAFRDELERLYRDHFVRGLTTDYVDRVGQVVHTQRYTRERLEGVSHVEAVQRVLRQAFRDDPATRDQALPEWLGGGGPGGLTATWRPSVAQLARVSGDFLDARGGFQRPTFMAPGMPVHEQVNLIQSYPGTHLLAGWSTVYPRFPQWSFDFGRALWGFEAWLDRCFAFEKIPVVVVPFVASDSLRQHLDRIRPVLERLQAARRLVSLQWGWEINDIADWTADGDTQLEYLQGLRAMVDDAIPIALHWTPERWSGWPSFHNTVGRPEDEGDELRWLLKAGAVGRWLVMHYQSPWEASIPAIVERVYTLDQKNYMGPGICGRSATAGIPFVHAEHSRTRAHYEAVVAAAVADGRGGYL